MTEYLNRKKREVNNIPELAISRIRLHGNTGEWSESIADPENEGKYKDIPMANPDGSPVTDFFGGVILRIAFFAEYKGNWQPDGKGGKKNLSPIRRKTREFENFRDEQIELLDFSDGKTKTLKVFTDYPSFKDYSTPKDAEGNEGVSMYALKAAVYIFHLSLGKLYKLTVSGSSISEVFEYRNRKKSKTAVTTPYALTFPDAVDLSQVKTVFTKNSHVNPAGGTSYFVSFRAAALCSDEEMKAVIEQDTKIQTWSDAWKAVQKKADKPIEERLNEHGMLASEVTPEDSGYVPPQTSEQEIDVDSIPF